MQKLEAIVAPECFDGVMRALGALRLCPLQVTETATYDATKHPNRNGGAGCFAGSPQLKLELVLEPHDVKRAIEAIRNAGIGSAGVGTRVSVLDLRNAFDSLEMTAAPGARAASTVVALRPGR